MNTQVIEWQIEWRKSGQAWYFGGMFKTYSEAVEVLHQNRQTSVKDVNDFDIEWRLVEQTIHKRVVGI